MIKIKRMIKKLNLWKSSRTFGQILRGRDGRTGPGAWGSFLQPGLHQSLAGAQSLGAQSSCTSCGAKSSGM